MRLTVSEIKRVQSLTDRQTDGQTDGQTVRTDRIVNYSNSRCACARGLMKALFKDEKYKSDTIIDILSVLMKDAALTGTPQVYEIIWLVCLSILI